MTFSCRPILWKVEADIFAIMAARSDFEAQVASMSRIVFQVSDGDDDEEEDEDEE